MTIPDTVVQGEEFGITCYYDENTYLTFGPYGQEQGYGLRLREHVGDTDRRKDCPEKVAPGTKISLKAVTEGLRRSFYIKESSEEWRCVAILERVDYLCDEGWHVGKRFTGAMEGIFACTEGEEERIIQFERF